MWGRLDRKQPDLASDEGAGVNVFIDCEWNGYRGQLISMALVDEHGSEFYEVLHCSNPIEWVKENVMPVLDKPAIDQDTFNQRLNDYLQQYDELHIIADWPEDIAYLCNALIIRPFTRIGPDKIRFTVDQALFAAESEIPHNALADARAMMNYFEG